MKQRSDLWPLRYVDIRILSHPFNKDKVIDTFSSFYNGLSSLIDSANRQTFVQNNKEITKVIQDYYTILESYVTLISELALKPEDDIIKKSAICVQLQCAQKLVLHSTKVFAKINHNNIQISITKLQVHVHYIIRSAHCRSY